MDSDFFVNIINQIKETIVSLFLVNNTGEEKASQNNVHVHVGDVQMCAYMYVFLEHCSC